MKDHLIGGDVQCCDGNAAVINTSGGLCSVCDLTIAQPNLRPAHLVFSLEVAEHIPKDKEAAFLETVLSKSTQVLVLAWAVPGQGGVGHVNCRPNEHAIQKMNEAGFVHCNAESNNIRDAMKTNSCTGKWNSQNFKNTAMVFYRGDGSHC